MYFEYIKIKYTCSEHEGVFDGYQEVQNGYVKRHTDMNGETVDFSSFTSGESWVVDANPERPAWAMEIPVPEPEPVIPPPPPPEEFPEEQTE